MLGGGEAGRSVVERTRAAERVLRGRAPHRWGCASKRACSARCMPAKQSNTKHQTQNIGFVRQSDIGFLLKTVPDFSQKSGITDALTQQNEVVKPR